MALDKELYRKAHELYRQWNEFEFIDHVRNPSRRTPTEAWRHYVDLVEFCWKLSPQQSEWQRDQKLAELDRYYAQLQKLEAWRRARGKKP